MKRDREDDEDSCLCEAERSQLLRATERGDVERLKALVESHARDHDREEHARFMTAGNESGWTALMDAVYRGRVECVRLLLRQRHCPEEQLRARHEDGWTALMLAASDGQEVILSMLLKLRCFRREHAMARGLHGWTALILAARHGHEGCVRRLLDWESALAAVEDARGATALVHAAGRGHAGCVRLLLGCGAPGQRLERALLAAADVDTNLGKVVPPESGRGKCINLLLDDPAMLSSSCT
jgi:ankyrin repeat protein